MSAQPLPSSNRTRAWALRITGTLFFVALLVILDLRGDLNLQDVWEAISSASPVLVALSLLFYVPFLVVKAARWRMISTDMQMPMTWSEAWRIYAIGLAAGTFTPGQAGDALKAWFVQRLGYPLGRALGCSVLDRVFDVAALAVLGLLGVAVYGQRFAGQTPALVAWVIICIAGVAFFAYSPTRRWIVGIVSRRLSKLNASSGTTGKGASWSLKTTTLLLASLLTLTSFAVSIFRVWLLAAALGMWLNPLEIAGYVGLTTAAALVPVTIGGVGTRDAISVLALSQLGYPASQGLALAALILLLNLAQAITGWLIWLRYKPSVPAPAAQPPLDQPPAQPESARGRS